MAKKKPEKKASVKKASAKKTSKSSPPLPDRRVIEAMLGQALSGIFGKSGGAMKPVDRAQELMYQAFESPPAEQVQLARQALTVSRDCADAYVMLAENASSLPEALELYEQGVAAGKRALGPKAFKELAGEFWGFHETRPYMRARCGWGQCLWDAGRREEAVQNYQEMLKLNPNDNQGIREILAACLLQLGHDQETAALLKQYEDDASAWWAYGRALLAFRTAGDTEASRALLAEAQKRNKHVPAYLLGDKPMPRRMPDYVGFGDANEAMVYAASFLPGWRAAPGAITWLREGTRKQPRAAKKGKPAAKQTQRPPTDDELRALPQSTDDVWQVDTRQMPTWINVGGQPMRPWMALVLSRTDDFILAGDMSESPVAADGLWDAVAAAVHHPMVGDPHRPSLVEVSSVDAYRALEPRLKAIGVPCAVRDDLEQVDAVVNAMSQEAFPDDQMTAIVDSPGIERSQVASYFDAAAHFYRQKPWLHIPSDVVILVECSAISGGPWHAVVMGQSGLSLGLAIYDDLKMLRRLLSGQLSDGQFAKQASAISVSYGEAFELSAHDLAAVEQDGWPVEEPEAYPAVMRLKPGKVIAAPTSEELALLEACLRAIPAFMNQREPLSTTVPLSTGPIELTLSWADDK